MVMLLFGAGLWYPTERYSVGPRRISYTLRFDVEPPTSREHPWAGSIQLIHSPAQA